MTIDENDLALITLVEVCGTEAKDLDLDLLARCYEIQRRYQFNQDPSIASSRMEEAIDNYVDAALQKDRV